MARPNIRHAPAYFATRPTRLWHQHPPLFDTSDGPITDDDRRLALALIDALPDPNSRQWYAGAAERLRAALGL